MSHLRLFCAVIVCLILLAPQWAFSMAGSPSKKPIVLPDGALNAEQIDQQFRGKTALADVPVKGKKEVYYFAADGMVIETRDGLQKSGTWFVRKDGRLCIDLEGEHKDCRMIIKEGDQFMQYAAKQDGNHRYEQTYYNFRGGEHLQTLSPKPILPITTLSEKELITLFSDRTVESVTAKQGRTSLSYYSPDGKVAQLRNGVIRHGTWRVTSSARICLQMENLKEKCRIVVKEGDEYKKYIVKRNGAHQHSVSYRKFMQGKRF